MNVLISNSGTVSKPFLERIALLHGDITMQDSDAIGIVVPQNLDFKGSINESVAAGCGYDLDSFILENVYKPRIGDVYALPAGDLPCKHILLGIMPRYRTEFDMKDSDLAQVVRKMMELTRCMLLKSVAFPPLASGSGMFAKPKSARLIIQGITDRMEENIEDVRIVCDTPAVVEVFDRKLRVVGWGD
ncbi:MAG: macro domain-containing protein [Alphaproteobacteria bacterium]